MPKEDFRREVEKELIGRETEPWQIVYFKLYESQIPVVELLAIGKFLVFKSEQTDEVKSKEGSVKHEPD